MLEVNAEHALVKKLDGSVHFHDLAHILFDQDPYQASKAFTRLT